MIIISKTDDSNILHLKAESSIYNHISESLMARDPNCYFISSYKKKRWDGNIRFLQFDGNFQAGLLVEILRIAKKNKWIVKYDKNLILNDNKFEKSEIELSLDGINLYDDTQFPHVEKLLKYRIGMAKLPTSAGKSYIEIAMMNLYKLKGVKTQILIVPRASLVEQIYEDIISKSRFIEKEEVGRLYGGHKGWDKPIVIATWQSLNTLLQLDPKYGDKFELLIQDEVHVSSVSAKKVKEIINSFHPKYKYGFSATIFDKKSNKLEYLNLSSLFGPIVAKDTIKNLQSKDRITDAEIRVKFLEYPVQQEINNYKEYEEFTRYSELRRIYIERLIIEIKAKDEDGNILVLIRNVDFAKEACEQFRYIYGSENVHIISGSIKIDKRIAIKEKMKIDDGQILVATEGCFQIGENVPNLHYLILAQIRKSEIAQVQMVGRVLRKNHNKEKAIIYDIADDLIVIREKEDKEGNIRKIKKNFGKSHLKQRIATYKKYGFKIKDIEKVIL